MRRTVPQLLAVCLVALVVAGCGDGRRVTYVDPNPQHSVARPQLATPVSTHGLQVLERAKAVVRIRATVATVRTLRSMGDVDPAASIATTLHEDLALLEPQAERATAGSSQHLESALRRLAVTASAPDAVGDVATDTLAGRITRQLLATVQAAAVPLDARQDIGFRAAVLVQTLADAATALETALGADDTINDPDAYRRAYGLVTDAGVQQLDALAPRDARTIRRRIDALLRASMPGPRAPETMENGADVVEELLAIADRVEALAGIDLSYPDPDPTSPDQLRSLKRFIAAAAEAEQQGAHRQALATLKEANASALVPLAPSLAAVSMSDLTLIEHDLFMDLPDAIRSGSDMTAAAVSADEHIDDAIALLEGELETIREG